MAGGVQLLTDHVANKIAAGEVVERPASVVKELLENALDAGATQLTVEVVAGGRQLISVADNGSGMDRDDALLCLERHATSKIRDVDDIERIGTLGFRGEALPSIASVSRFVLTSRRRGELAGTAVEIAGGKVQDVRETGAPEGTEVRVRNLFFNVPARRKFLRGEQTELAHIRQVVQLYALAWPQVGLRLVADERELLNLPAAGSVRDRLVALYQPDFVRSLREVDYAAMDMRVTGMAGVPSLSRKDRRDQVVFVNRRPASAPSVGYAIGEAYRGVLPPGRQPVVFLFIEVPPDTVDVNVHPQKRDVRFRQAREVRDLVITGLVRALQQPVRPARPAAEEDGGARTEESTGAAPDATAEAPAQTDPGHACAGTIPPVPPAPGAAPPTELAGPTQRDWWAERRSEEPLGPWRTCRLIGRVGSDFVLLETEDGLVVMDPQAAHERVLYERYLADVLGAEVRAQALLTPETVVLGPADAQRVRDHLDTLQEMGFGLSEFGGDTFLLDALPDFLGDTEPAGLIGDVAVALETGGSRGGSVPARERVARIACRASVKRASQITDTEIERLVEDLAGATMPYTCPRGRPTLIFMGFNELNRKFGRV